jgi:hypothetical protein
MLRRLLSYQGEGGGDEGTFITDIARIGFAVHATSLSQPV